MTSLPSWAHSPAKETAWVWEAAYAITWAFGDLGSTFQPSLGWVEVSEGFREEELASKQFWQMSRDWSPEGTGRGQSPWLGDWTLGIQVPQARTTVPSPWGQGRSP